MSEENMDKKPDPTNLGLPRDFEYTEEMLKDDLKAVELYKENERKMIPSRHIDDINRLSDKQIDEIKESIRKGENEDDLLWFWDLNRGVYEEIKKTVNNEIKKESE